MNNTSIIIKLRELTGAGMMDCKQALDEANGDLDKAIEILRKKGAIKAAKKQSERQTKEGIVHAYVHSNNKVGVLLELLCETDFVARNEEFQNLAHDLAMQIAATNPLYLKPEDIPQEIIEKEKEMYLEEIRGQEKPPSVIDKIIAGKLEKYYEDVCLLKQPFIKDEDITIEELINQKIAKIGEKIEVGRFIRFAI
jgi:elongation factor Ts